MDDRERIVREIARNAAVIFECSAEAVEVLAIVGDGPEGGFHAIARATTPDAPKTIRTRGASEQDALWALLDQTIDRANGENRPSQNLVMTPQLREAFRLLKLSRLEVIEEIRRELETNDSVVVAEPLSEPKK